MSIDYYKHLDSKLGAEFELFAVENADWMAANVPDGAIVVLQAENPAFNSCTWQIAEANRHVEEPLRPIVLVPIRGFRPAVSRIVWAEAELIGV
jgi:hypothetical protein